MNKIYLENIIYISKFLRLLANEDKTYTAIFRAKLI